MDHVRRVRRVERRRHLRDESRDLVWRERAALREHVAKGLARDELHDHERVRALAAFVEDRDDVRVHDRRGAASLVGEPRAERLIGTGAEKLDRDVASELLVAPTPDLARAAFVDALEQAVTPREQAVQRGGRTGFACHVPRRPQVPCEDARRAERAFGAPPRRSGRCQGSRAPRQ